MVATLICNSRSSVNEPAWLERHLLIGTVTRFRRSLKMTQIATSAETAELTPRAMKWLATLNDKVRPELLPRSYPRIANKLAELWSEPDLTRKYAEELLVDRRGDRAGFPQEVILEIGTLMHFYDKELHPIQGDVWSKIWSDMA